MRNYKLIKISLMIVINSIITFGGTHAELIPAVKSKSIEDPQRDSFPDHLYFASFLYQ